MAKKKSTVVNGVRVTVTVNGKGLVSVSASGEIDPSELSAAVAELMESAKSACSELGETKDVEDEDADEEEEEDDEEEDSEEDDDEDSEEDDDEDDDEDDEDEEESAKAYEDMDLKELRALCKKRGIKKTPRKFLIEKAKKGQLIATLENDDENEED